MIYLSPLNRFNHTAIVLNSFQKDIWSAITSNHFTNYLIIFVSICFFWRNNISALLDKWSDFKRLVQNNYFEHINPKLGQLRGASGFRSLKRSVLPNNFAMWLGIATIVTSLLILLETGLSWYWQLLFILLILFFGPLLTQIYQSLFSGSDNVLTVYPGKQYIGYKVTLEKPISNGSGEVVLHDQVWGIYGDDLPSGTRVKIIAVKKNKLYVVTAMGSFDHQKIEAKD